MKSKIFFLFVFCLSIVNCATSKGPQYKPSYIQLSEEEKNKTNRELQELLVRIKKEPNNSSLFIMVAEKYILQEKYSQALDALANIDSGFEDTPNYYKAVFLQGYIYAILGNIKQAEKSIEILFEKLPDDYLGYYLRALVVLQKSAKIPWNQHKKQTQIGQIALENLNKAISLNPKAIELYLLRDSVYKDFFYYSWQKQLKNLKQALLVLKNSNKNKEIENYINERIYGIKQTYVYKLDNKTDIELKNKYLGIPENIRKDMKRLYCFETLSKSDLTSILARINSYYRKKYGSPQREKVKGRIVESVFYPELNYKIIMMENKIVDVLFAHKFTIEKNKQWFNKEFLDLKKWDSQEIKRIKEILLENYRTNNNNFWQGYKELLEYEYPEIQEMTFWGEQGGKSIEGTLAHIIGKGYQITMTFKKAGIRIIKKENKLTVDCNLSEPVRELGL